MRTMTALLAALLVARSGAAQAVVSEQTAFRLSLWGTLIPVGAGAAIWMAQGPPTGDPLSGPDRSVPALLMAGGFALGPAIGYGSAGMGGRGFRGFGLRAGLTLLSFLPAIAICGWSCSSGDTEYDLAWLVIGTGAGLSAASAIYDIARVKHNVREQAARRTAEGAAWYIAPVYTPERRALGLSVGVTF